MQFSTNYLAKNFVTASVQALNNPKPGKKNIPKNKKLKRRKKYPKIGNKLFSKIDLSDLQQHLLAGKS